MTTLTITQRDSKTPLEALRAAGQLPGVFYGPKEASMAIAFDAPTFNKVLREAGESTVVTLSGVGEEKDTLIHDIQFDPVSGEPVHVDFYVMEKGKKAQTHVALEFTGESVAVKSLGGTLMKVLHELEIEAMPKDLPHEILVDISRLTTFDSTITVKDIPLPAGVVALTDADETVAAIAPPAEEIEEPVEEIDMASIEVEKKGKEETPEDETDTPAAA